MDSKRFTLLVVRPLLLIGMVMVVAFALAIAQSAQAAEALQLTTVTIKATDPYASERGPDSGEFTVYRDGSAVSAGDLTVYYKVSGAATNGVDYRLLSGKVVIARGALSAKIPVVPLDDNLREGMETVVVTVITPACIAIYPPPPACYQAGWPDTATVFLYDND